MCLTYELEKRLDLLGRGVPPMSFWFARGSDQLIVASPKAWFQYMFLQAATSETISAIGRAPRGGTQSQSSLLTSLRLRISECQSSPANASSRK